MLAQHSARDLEVRRCVIGHDLPLALNELHRCVDQGKHHAACSAAAALGKDAQGRRKALKAL